MPLRLLAAAFAAALLATMGLMFARVASTPSGLLDTGTGDVLLLHHLALGFVGSVALQVFLLYRPNIGIYRALAWGGAGFVALTLMPWLVLPGTLPGQVTAQHPLRWLIVAGCTAGGLWLLWWPGLNDKARRNRRLAGLGLLLLPLLAGAFGAGDPTLPETGAADGHGEDPGAEFAVWQGFGLNLLFWLLLGLFSLLTARRIVQRPQGVDGGENPPGNGPGIP